ncbi:hypothetical protein TCAL_00586 [Tigriopus californicus]|uniref:E3 ubiquitin-protein ligase Sina-like RING finger domain-containing protein n=1 Tax=Tigriopus californicus TaxID=6832 RepID=A0A553PCH3_TIGCA|nr:uncharacterized protein LOC131893054 [Tigriopus californicus]TRY75360.1 hypothetical protein TCAL_00586 [Tigriopus californicus]
MSNNPSPSGLSLPPMDRSSSSASQSFNSILGQLASSHLTNLIQGHQSISQSSPAPVHRDPTWLHTLPREQRPRLDPFQDRIVNGNRNFQNTMPAQSNRRSRPELSVFVGPLPPDVTCDEIQVLLRPHQPKEISLRPVGRTVYGHRRSIAAEVAFRTLEERRACLAEFERSDLHSRRWPRPIRVEPFRSNSSHSTSSIPEARSESLVVSDPTSHSREEEGILEPLSDGSIRDTRLEKKRCNIRDRQNIQDERNVKGQTYRLLAEGLEQQLLAEQKTKTAHEKAIRNSQKGVEACKRRIHELCRSEDSLREGYQRAMDDLDERTANLLVEWKTLQDDATPESASAETPILADAKFSVEPEIECIVCVEPMLGAIFQCCNGHCVCNTCFERMTHCAMCRVKLHRPGIRCRLLETLVQKIMKNPTIPIEKSSTDGS